MQRPFGVRDNNLIYLIYLTYSTSYGRRIAHPRSHNPIVLVLKVQYNAMQCQQAQG